MNNLPQNKNSRNHIPPPSEGSVGSAADSLALQEIIDILKEPFQTSCDTCNGLGFVNSGQNCQNCDGSGKVIDSSFR